MLRKWQKTYHSCYGSGKETCGSCNGHGYFTTTARASATAIPYREIYANDDKYKNEFINFAKNQSNDFLSEKIKFELSQDKYIINETYYIFSYFGETFLCELNYEILNKNYLGVGF